MEKIQQEKANLKYQLQNTMERKSSRKRKINKLVTILCIICVGLAIVPLGSILFEVIKNGVSALSVEFLTQRPGSMISGRGGIGPAIQGTLITVGIASIIAAPVGIFAGIYLAEFAGNGPLPHAVRFFNDVLTGLPSIVLGIVGYIVIVLVIGSFSVWAGSFALSIIMIPIVVRVTEESLKVVPNSIREAGYSLGIPKWKITLHITLKTAFSGVLTGIVIGISRIAGETAPLIMTILGTSLFFTGFDDPVDALPLRIWRLASQPYDSAHSQGWAAALILILIVLLFSVTLRLLAARKGFKVRVIRYSNV
jgi:phosphate transport system permease protein